MKYTSFDQAMSVVRDCTVGTEMVKCDIKSAFHLLPVHPDDFELLGFAFQGEFYMDRALPMGCSVQLFFGVGLETEDQFHSYSALP